MRLKKFKTLGQIALGGGLGCSLRLRIGGTWQGQETLLGWVLIACPLCALNVFGAGLMSVPDESPRARFLTRGRGSYARCATSLAFKIPKSIQMGFLYVADMVPARLPSAPLRTAPEILGNLAGGGRGDTSQGGDKTF